jgi:hypothetical protein
VDVPEDVVDTVVGLEVLVDCGRDAEGLLEDVDNEEEVGEIEEVVVGTLVVGGVEVIDVTIGCVVMAILRTELQ